MHHRALPRTYPEKLQAQLTGRLSPAAATAATAAAAREAASAERAAATEARAAATGGGQRRGSAGQAASEERGVEGRQVIVPDVPIGNDVGQPSHRHEVGTDLRPTVGELKDDRPGQVLRENVLALLELELVSLRSGEIGLEALDLIADS